MAAAVVADPTEAVVAAVSTVAAVADSAEEVRTAANAEARLILAAAPQAWAANHRAAPDAALNTGALTPRLDGIRSADPAQAVMAQKAHRVRVAGPQHEEQTKPAAEPCTPHLLTASGIRSVDRTLQSEAALTSAAMPNSLTLALEAGAAAVGAAALDGGAAGDIRATVSASAAGDAVGDMGLAGASAGIRIGRSIPILIGTACGGAILTATSAHRAMFTRISISPA